MSFGAKECIRKVMDVPEMKGHKLAVHELRELIQNKLGQMFSENNLASRLPEMALEGEVIGTLRPGCSYKEWEYLGWNTAQEHAGGQEAKFYFFSLNNQETSPYFMRWTKCLSAAAKHLNDNCPAISVFTGTHSTPVRICTISK